MRIRCHRSALALLLVATCAVGCGTDPGSAVVDADGAGDAAPVTEGCTSNADCETGQWCVGPPGCDAVWTCVDEVPCSAAPPFDACTCAGVLVPLSAGCPGQKYGWSRWVPEYRIGTACDPDNPTEWADVTAQLDGLDVPDGTLVGGVLRDGVAGVDLYEGLASVGDGAARLTWYDLADPSRDDWSVLVWVDVDGDAQCGEADLRWARDVAIDGADVVVPLGDADAGAECPPER